MEPKTIILNKSDFKSSLEWGWVLISVGIPRDELENYSEVIITSDIIEVNK